ncbi:hypothetical protein HY968_04100 [Candidatus Kaiserbacteria bacterium]|nr:hypothetical protein [Candidatus Kaiserbacteria bacterium]
MKRGLVFAAAFLAAPLVAFATTTPSSIPMCGISTPPAIHYAGGPAELVWYSQNATSASIAGIGAVPLQGSRTVYPTRTTTYTMTVANSAASRTCSVIVTISSPPAPAPILYYDSPANASVLSNLMRPVMLPYITRATSYPYSNQNQYGNRYYDTYDEYTIPDRGSFIYTEDTYYPDSNFIFSNSYRCVGGGWNGESLCYGDNSPTTFNNLFLTSNNYYTSAAPTSNGEAPWSWQPPVYGPTDSGELMKEPPSSYPGYIGAGTMPAGGSASDYGWDSFMNYPSPSLKDSWGDCGYWDCSGTQSSDSITIPQSWATPTYPPPLPNFESANQSPQGDCGYWDCSGASQSSNSDSQVILVGGQDGSF